MTDWSDEQLAAVASVDIVTVARDDAPPARVHKLRLWNKVAALDTLAKYLGLLTEKIELDLRTSAELMRYVIAHKLVPLPPP